MLVADLLTVADCDIQLRRLRIRLHDQTLAEYEIALLREDIDEWLERRFLCEGEPTE